MKRLFQYSSIPLLLFLSAFCVPHSAFGQYPFRTYLAWDSTTQVHGGNGALVVKHKLPDGSGALYDAQRIYRDSTVWRTRDITRLTLNADGALSGAFVTAAGSVLSGDYLVDGSVLAEKMTAQAQSFNLSLAFTPSDHNTIAWNSGTIILANLNFTALNAGSTGDMTGLTYVYFNGSSTLQVTTDYSAAVGENVLLLAVCKPAPSSSQQAFVVPAVGVAFLNEENIGANSISANKLQANSVTAAKINVSQLSAISADMGSLTAGEIEIGSTNKIWLNDAADGALHIGGNVKANAPFQVTAAGVLTATSAVLKTAGSTKYIDIGNSVANEMKFVDGSSEVVRIGSNVFQPGTSGILVTDATVYSISDGAAPPLVGIAEGSGPNYALYLEGRGTGTNYGIYATAYNGSTNWAGYFNQGNVKIVNDLDVDGAIEIGNTVNVVAPTSPNRTITMVINGTTYYIPAKTTND